MTPQLVALDGPLHGTAYTLDGDEVVIGRSDENGICIRDPKVSRHHCSIRHSGGRLQLVDLGSRNGVFVNDLRVSEQFLDHGDRIRIGGYQFEVILSDEGAAGAQIRVDDSIATTATAVTAPARAHDLQPSGVIPFLLKITTALSVAKAAVSVRSTSIQGILEGLLLELLFDVIPAERGAVIITGGDADQPSLTFTRERGAARSSTIPVSRRVMQRVLSGRVGLLLTCFEDSINPNAPNDSRHSSILAAPLFVSGFEGAASSLPFGVIYLSVREGRATFDEGHLNLLTEVSIIASTALENALYLEWLRAENERLRSVVYLEHSMVGDSRPVRDLCSQISRVASTEATVLISGESGTGKELVARALHENSPRARKPLVSINCAAITETLLESELFGHERGAFTGAIGQKLGKLEMAEGGTVFLDEIAEMPLVLQAKMLRVLQEREFERVGGTRTIKLNIRLVAATNRDLAAEVRAGRFREDLYYRLNVVLLRTPALRERGADILTLADYFAQRHAGRSNRKFIGFSERARSLLLNYDWPGNVRELENAIERAIVLGAGECISEEDLPESILDSLGPDPEGPAISLQRVIHEAKRKAVASALTQSDGNVTKAAKLLGVNPNYLHRLINNLKLR